MTGSKPTKNRLSPRDQKKRISALADNLEQGVPLSQDETAWLANALGEIAQGRDANDAFGIKYGRGNSKADEESRVKLSLIMHWIAGAIDKKEGLGLTLEDAFEKAQTLFAASKGPKYDAEYLKKAWYRHKHMQDAERKEFDPDSPY